jgi:hypothetical protein
MTEEASRLRANAASTIIQKQLELITLEQNFSSFKIKSSTTKDLYNNELKNILQMGNSISSITQQLKSIIPMTCSAVSASVYPSNCSDKVTSMIKELDEVIKSLVTAQSELSKFDKYGELEYNSRQIEYILYNTTKAKEGIKSILNQLHKLIFG